MAVSGRKTGVDRAFAVGLQPDMQPAARNDDSSHPSAVRETAGERVAERPRGKRASPRVGTRDDRATSARLDALPTALTHVRELTPDPANARRHGPRNVGTIVSALHEVGAARSIVIDEDGVILAGNATVEAAAEAGITRVHVVDVDGETIVAVRRTGLTPQQKARLALFDNRAAELAEGWNTDVLRAMQADGASLEGLWSDAELGALLSAPVTDADWSAAFDALPSGERAPIQQMTFTLSDAQAARVRAALAAAKRRGPFNEADNENGNGNALAFVCEAFLADEAATT
jgi:hypothetical protein